MLGIYIWLTKPIRHFCKTVDFETFVKPKEIQLKAALPDKGKRVDIFISEQVLSLTRSRVKMLIEKGNISLDDTKPRPSTRLIPGNIIKVTIPETAPVEIKGQKVEFGIIYEDRDIIVVNKPPGLVVHPGPGNPDMTLVNGLMEHCRDLSGIGGETRPGIVHRLDKGTSGVLVVAKNDLAHNSLAKQFSKRRVSKKYLAIVLGRPKNREGRWDWEIGRHRKDRKKMSSYTNSGRPAVTNYRFLGYKKGVGLLSLQIETGRTHQIRVHCKNGGCPVAADDLYGGVKRISDISHDDLRQRVKALERPALHSYKLRVAHPVNKQEMEFVAPLPLDMERIINILGIKYE